MQIIWHIPLAPAAPAAAHIAPVAPEPLAYTYSTGNEFAAFAKFNGKNYFMWRRNMGTRPHAHGQWEGGRWEVYR